LTINFGHDICARGSAPPLRASVSTSGNQIETIGMSAVLGAQPARTTVPPPASGWVRSKYCESCERTLPQQKHMSSIA
jgi:hypothetical protein